MNGNFPARPDRAELPLGVWVAVGFLRIFSWCIVGLTCLGGLALFLSWCFFGLEWEKGWWAVDLLAAIILILLLIGCFVDAFATGLLHAHRHRSGVVDSLRWLRFASAAAGRVKWLALVLMLACMYLVVACLGVDNGPPLPTVIAVLTGHAALLAGMIFLCRWLKECVQKELALRRLVIPGAAMHDAPPTGGTTPVPSPDLKDE
ncbi:hypothetical protein [Luteolibacter sp. LG18]|uniref:hypothetical protein n=1 Tax=Luteolibacter sp. LG18 TaxID=2819286 RepID=UPI0030C70D3B